MNSARARLHSLGVLAAAAAIMLCGCSAGSGESPTSDSTAPTATSVDNQAVRVAAEQSAAAEAARVAAEQEAARVAAEQEAARVAAEQEAARAAAERVAAEQAESDESEGSDDEEAGWYDSRGRVSSESADRAVEAGIAPGEDVPGYLRCGTVCGEEPTSGELQQQWLQEQGLVNPDGSLVNDTTAACGYQIRGGCYPSAEAALAAGEGE